MDFDTLLPELIFDAVSAQGLRATGALLPLNSYENRVYEIALEDSEPIIAKFYRPNRWSFEQIAEEHRFIAAVAAAEIPVVSPLALENPLAKQNTIGQIGDFFYAFFPKFRGREEPELTVDHRRWLGRSLGRLHNVGANFTAHHRLELTPETYGYQSVDAIFAEKYVPTEIIPSLDAHWLQAIQLTENYFTTGLQMIPLHGDCHWGNILWNHNGPCLLDFDDMVIASPVQDVWMLFHGSAEELKIQKDSFFEGYETFRHFDYDTLILMEPLRTLRMIHHAAWIGRRFQEPAFKRAFPYYHETRYWESFLLAIKEQIALMQDL